ncbi:Rrf2 family transcriptional regulator [Poseidonibacter ostreae]|jgi:Rrf2 family transcriptional regulator, cysteine metabolism repressor|uniref:Rrf2 family transcriptional regulator n=1 Tax=Poseidonibacter ostreae TaxID=2654171 RepID=A0A6L4WUI0_9BACT|nr:Rrf2 family transcriptional regulator [Poseidonibacter ostreae]KAB7884208.1 Rrf2 family transcriptional regulator [Poseidonibacter ostreae]KAB7889983.1 Rrf2 family transcriptional regulator [Poseidonibacter ostreae]KAB7891497.1 Rrf2 family transcriptional regulator [Poseidonibacter ostreae]MAC83083.1 Rrf2 family transcriptional regulator [Arcobacter sp.]|tara:strand:+ start:1127 stop:1540 length:414 start_codon:yes stop_codon:yes gene_type:complete
MPLISTKGVYGLTAMYELSKHEEDTPMQIKEISSNASIPQNYLEQLLSKLRRAELVKSIRGAKGGYILAKEPKDIKVLDILIALEGDIRVVDVKAENPILNIFFDESKEQTKKIFDLNLSNLDDYQDKYNEFLHYSI